ncbi:MAG: PDDEXK nuclease domain-containing protein [Nanoarchaeota archaeon]|nr:PDDEXK nuclease domain-containing protein [Nanoarchaeota archaeon]
MKKEIVKKREYTNLITSIGALLEEARKIVYLQINQILVKTYWEVGKRIVEYEQKGKEKAAYGSKLLDTLSKDLIKLYGKGFSRDNLEKMRKFYLTFPNSETLSRKLSWSHYCLVMRLDNPLARKFYIKEMENENWSVRELDRQINSMVFERIALSKDKKSVLQLAQKGHVIEKAKDLVKDPYILEFLGLEKLDRYSETELEEKIITNLQKFLLELGKGFMFVARQQKITLEDEHFYIDLVFYNRLLKCFVLIELKIGKLTHKDLGQLQMYVNYYDREIKQKEENPSIGILLCADKKEAIVKYTLPKNNKQLFASKYKLYLPSKKELEEEVEKLV